MQNTPAKAEIKSCKYYTYIVLENALFVHEFDFEL